MAEGVGINVPLIYTLVFALGTWLAALGGALAAPQQSLVPSMGEKIIIESFIVVVIGGMGSFPGAFVGALLLGLLGSFGTMFAGQLQDGYPLPFTCSGSPDQTEWSVQEGGVIMLRQINHTLLWTGVISALAVFFTNGHPRLLGHASF